MVNSSCYSLFSIHYPLVLAARTQGHASNGLHHLSLCIRSRRDLTNHFGSFYLEYGFSNLKFEI